MRKGMFAFILMFAIDLGFLYLTINAWNTGWALLWGIFAFSCIFSTIKITYLAYKTNEWPEVVGGPSITYLNKPRNGR
ncbi:MAG: hypothetical protein A3A97_04890 [Candidatus Terrybacteria bacterium RIFCSPLOWO2_01_FULL_40_23]|uniref:Uncharacterized protein n=1 Tax=Candidatus Terrybacteria bacterium RIFCSPLOWO2_01_FULL_40_23 TaxID=1802366 RepID=A0A1G2PX97_9BACT|nr:MAG: hypothetical protein A3A97_04890 [Candidatus Terrybacteria bacterium RIFCSPLOWO2_01_FULL_40_23]